MDRAITGQPEPEWFLARARAAWARDDQAAQQVPGEPPQPSIHDRQPGAGLRATARRAAALAGLATFPEQLRPRVIALTSSMWIAPALVGPPVAALISSVAGWRWAVIAVLLPVVVAARLMVVRQISLLPELRSSQRTTPLMAALLVALLVGALGLAILGSGRGGHSVWRWPWPGWLQFLPLQRADDLNTDVSDALEAATQ